MKGNFSCTDIFNILNNNNNNNNNPTTRGNEYLTMDRCASLKKECVNCVDEKQNLIIN